MGSTIERVVTQPVIAGEREQAVVSASAFVGLCPYSLSHIRVLLYDNTRTVVWRATEAIAKFVLSVLRCGCHSGSGCLLSS